MEKLDFIANKIYTQKEMASEVRRWRLKSRTVVFTNGCFDVFHPGHLKILNEAARFGQRLVVGVNSDASVKRLKGESRPVHAETDRAKLLASLQQVAAVVVFEEDTPLNLILALQPDVLVKGGDYSKEQIVGAKEVEAEGGRIEIVPLLEGHSSSGIIEGKTD